MKKQQETVDNIQEMSLEDILADRFARYSKYIIQERALPDARDGLKPVQRRILYAMYEAGNTWDKPYHKSAKTVGDVIGNYHPHGDTSVYDAMVRLSQDWKMNLPLVDMQGNNGSIDDDPAAAMRYTEARLGPISGQLLTDIDKETVEWTPNFSDEKMEPTVLPAAWPNLLTQGTSGIAAGYATNIPPHNLEEIIDAACEMAAHPDSDKVYEIVKGPDFPTGGIVMGQEGIGQALRTGRGKVTIRSRCEIVEQRTVNQIVVTEIPYDVVKSQLVKKIDDIRLNRKAEGLLDVRDESDRTGLKIVVDLKKEAPADVILNYLYKNTDLQATFAYNMIAIVNQRPVLLGLKQALQAFLDFRRGVIGRRSAFDLRRKQARYHVLEGLLKAMSILDEVIVVIRASRNKGDARKNLCERFGFTEAQAEAIVMMRLYRLSHMDIAEVEAEKAQLEKDIATLQGILDSPRKLDQVMVRELKAVKKQFPSPRKTVISAREANIVIDPLAMIPDEQVMTAVSRHGYIKRTSLRSYNASGTLLPGLKDSDELLAAGEVSTRSELLLFTEKGRYFRLPVHQLAESKWKDEGTHLSAFAKLEASEKIAAVFSVQEAADCEIVQLSAHGQLKRTPVAEFLSSRPGRVSTSMKLGELDRLVCVLASHDVQDEILIGSHKGMGVHYRVDDIPESSGKSRGVKGISLTEDDEVAAAAICSEEQFLLLADNGAIKRMRCEEVPVTKRPARGIQLFKPVKSRNYKTADLVMVQLRQPVQVQAEGQAVVVEPVAVPLMLPRATFHMPPEPAENGRFLEPLRVLGKGSWVTEEKADQPALFENV